MIFTIDSIPISEAAESSRLFCAFLSRLALCWSLPLHQSLASPESTLRALWLAALGKSCSYQQAAAEPLPPLSAAQAQTLEALVSRFESGVPLAHLTRRWRFMDLDLFAGPEALIPRKETEFLCSRALDLISSLARDRREVTIVEPCTGSGNLAVAMAHRQPACRVWAIDLSEPALNLARRNAAHFRLSERIQFQVGDLFAPVESSLKETKADLVICNPPYISSGKLDALPMHILRQGPRLAFDGGPFGLTVVSRLIDETPTLLKPGSFLCFEAGIGQGKFLANLMQAMPAFSSVHVEFDPASQTPIVIAQTRTVQPEQSVSRR